MSSDVVSTVKEITAAFSKNNENINAHFSAINERLERIEASDDRPRAGARTSTPYVKHRTANGPIFELQSGVKMADVKELQPQKAPEVSLGRWLSAHVAGEQCGDREAVAFAREVKAGELVTTTSGTLIPAHYQAQWIDLLRAASVLNRAGMRTLTMEAKTENMAAITGDPSVSWHSEAGAISAANPTFAARTLTAQTLVARCTASLEIAQDSPDFGAQLAAVMTKAMAAEVDRVGLEGTGTPPQPKGIKNTAGRSTITGIGAIADYSKIVAGLGKLLGSNNDLAQISQFAVMNPNCWAGFSNLVTGIASDKSPLRRPTAIENMQFLVTSNIAGSAATSPQVVSTIYLGDFRELLFGVRLESAIEILKIQSFATNLVLEFIGYLRCDYTLTRPASFCTLEGVLGSTT